MNRALYRTRIKFCGMTRAGDVRLAGELGVDAVGFVFAEGSPRRLTPAEARQLRLALAPMVSAVALFRDNTVAEVREVVRQVRPALLQFTHKEQRQPQAGKPNTVSHPMRPLGAHIQKQHRLVDGAVFALRRQVGHRTLFAQAGDEQQCRSRARYR